MAFDELDTSDTVVESVGSHAWLLVHEVLDFDCVLFARNHEVHELFQ